MKHFFPKGRQTDALLADQIRTLVGADLQRDLLIENLHKVQDHFGSLSKDLIAALAEVMRLSQAQVFEVASFYAHFDLEGSHSSKKYCASITCSLFKEPARNGEPVSCVGQCGKAPVQFDLKDTITVPDYITFEDYNFETLDKVKGQKEHVLAELDKAGLRGLGGAGFPVAKKWEFLLNSPGDRVLVVNSDEGEPGTFKDQHCLETNPHQMIEGMLIAAEVIDAKDIYIYLRDEYPAAREILKTELAKLDTPGRTIHLRRGAGAYICGEETALLESLEGKRGLPRIKPPYPAVKGLFGRPTLIHNVETLWRVTEILRDGAEAYINKGRPRFYSLSGRVKKPGVYELPSNTTVAQLIETAGGMAKGHTFKAYLPGGASGGILPAHLDDVPLDCGQLEQYGCFVGSAAVVVLGHQDNMKDVVSNLMNFFDHESCGQCTPCRVGCEKIAMMLNKGHVDEGLFEELGAVMQSSSICGLGQAAPNPLLTGLKYFAEDFA